jgi:hypothetical protein
MDWGMMQNPTVVVQTACMATTGGGSGLKTSRRHLSSRNCHHGCLRPRLRFGLVLSTLIVVADALLRFSWTLRFVARFPTNDAYVLCVQFLEIFRRAIWNLLRVEWENIKQKKNATKRLPKIKARDSLSDHDPEEQIAIDDDDDDLEFTTLLPGGSLLNELGLPAAPSSSSVVIVGTPATVLASATEGKKNHHGRKNSGSSLGGGGAGPSLKK